MRNEDHYPTSKTCAEEDAPPTIQFGRREHLYCPRGVDPREDLAILSEAISASADLFVVNGTLVYVNDDDGTLEQITKFNLPQIVRRHVVTKRLVNHGTADAPNWKCEYHPFEPNELTTILLLRQSQERGGLGWRAPKVDAATSPGTRSAPAIFALGEFSNRQR